MRIAVTGGSGRLGTALLSYLHADGDSELISIDTQTPLFPPDELHSFALDAINTESLADCLGGADVVVHLAAKHGAHLAAGLSEEACWASNVDVTRSVLTAAALVGVRRFIYASSTSVFGKGTPRGAALAITESMRPRPADIYDHAKLRGEEMLLDHPRFPDGSIILRLGRFDYEDELSHEFRKLSTGLDVRDAARAISRVISAPSIPESIYCVASDIRLNELERRLLGEELEGVVRNAMPNLSRLCQEQELPLPARVGKSVSSERFGRAFGWTPAFTVDDWAAGKLRQSASGNNRTNGILPLCEAVLAGTPASHFKRLRPEDSIYLSESGGVHGTVSN